MSTGRPAGPSRREGAEGRRAHRNPGAQCVRGGTNRTLSSNWTQTGQRQRQPDPENTRRPDRMAAGGVRPSGRKPRRLSEGGTASRASRDGFAWHCCALQALGKGPTASHTGRGGMGDWRRGEGLMKQRQSRGREGMDGGRSTPPRPPAEQKEDPPKPASNSLIARRQAIACCRVDAAVPIRGRWPPSRAVLNGKKTSLPWWTGQQPSHPGLGLGASVLACRVSRDEAVSHGVA